MERASKPASQAEPKPVTIETFTIEALDKSVTYLLPHEYELLTAIMEQLSSEQKELGVHLGDAMSQSSETFHDNAPQEAIVSEAAVLVKRAEPVIKALGAYRVVHYPEVDCDYITLGSTAHIILNGEKMTVRIVGASWLYPNYNDEIEKISLMAPLAEVLLGKKEEENITTEIHGRRTQVEILQIEQSYFG